MKVEFAHGVLPDEPCPICMAPARVIGYHSIGGEIVDKTLLCPQCGLSAHEQVEAAYRRARRKAKTEKEKAGLVKWRDEAVISEYYIFHYKKTPDGWKREMFFLDPLAVVRARIRG